MDVQADLSLCRSHRSYCRFCPIIRKTYLYNFDSLKPHFHIVKLGFTGVYIIFLFLLKNIDCGYPLEPPRRGGSNEYPQSMFWADIWKKNIRIFVSESFQILEVKVSIYLNRRVFVMAGSNWREDVQGEPWSQNRLPILPWTTTDTLPLRKHACLNILKILPPKKWKFPDKNFWYFSYFCSKHRLWYSLEPP